MHSTDRQRVLTGIQPSGTLHLGNYLGAIRPALALAREHEAYYFVADAHALTTMRDPDELNARAYEVAATFLALGLDPDRVVFYRQADVPEIFELATTLSCVTPKGLMNRAHKYKEMTEDNERVGRAPDHGVNMGVFNYPVLMAADILACEVDLVPVGQDNRQHLEMADDIAHAFNRVYGDVLRVPEGLIIEEVATIRGLDGRKMSKSYGNVIPIFATPEDYRRLTSRIVTDSRRPEEPKDPEACNVFGLLRHFAHAEEVEAVRLRYLDGGIGYAEVKARLADLLEETFGPLRPRYEELTRDHDGLDRIFEVGAERARDVAGPVLRRVRHAVGISRRGFLPPGARPPR